MKEAPEIAQTIYSILSNFYIDLTAYREVHKHLETLDRNDPSRPVWIVFSNNCLMMATVEWCKVFGSSHNNRTHYTTCIDKMDGIEDTVQEMKEFRDKYISHNDGYDKPVPFMDKAVEVVRRFDQIMLEKYITPNTEPYYTIEARYRNDIRKCISSIAGTLGTVPSAPQAP